MTTKAPDGFLVRTKEANEWGIQFNEVNMPYSYSHRENSDKLPHRTHSEVPLPDTPHIQRNTVNDQMEKMLIYLI